MQHRLVFELLGDNLDMAKEEVAGLLDILGLAGEHTFDDHLLHGLDVDIDADSLEVMGNRLGLTRSLGNILIGPCASEEEFLQALDGLGELELQGDTFAIKPKRFKSFHPDTVGTELAAKVGEHIRNRTGLRVDLDSPDVTIDLFLSDKIYLSHRSLTTDRSDLESRRPHLRKHFSPVSLHPKFARACINLARCNNNFLDPFCGTGGFLIEGGLIGLEVYGSDIDTEMVSGARENLGQFGTKEFHLLTMDVGDCGKWKEDANYPQGGFDAVVADPPYGRSSSTMGEDTKSIYKRAFRSLGEVIKPGGHLMIVLPEKADIQFVEGHFENLAVFEQYVHGSLTRYYCLFRK